jgi:hypothetical protein
VAQADNAEGDASGTGDYIADEELAELGIQLGE